MVTAHSIFHSTKSRRRTWQSAFRGHFRILLDTSTPGQQWQLWNGRWAANRVNNSTKSSAKLGGQPNKSGLSVGLCRYGLGMSRRAEWWSIGVLECWSVAENGV